MPPRNILLTLTRIWIPYNGNKLSGRHYDLRLQDTVFTVHGDFVQITTENLTSVQPWSEIFLFRYFCSLTFCLCVLTRIVLKNWHIFKTYLSKNWHLPQTPDNWIVRKLRKCSRVWILSKYTHGILILSTHTNSVPPLWTQWPVQCCRVGGPLLPAPTISPTIHIRQTRSSINHSEDWR